MREIFNSDVTPISEDVRRLPNVADESRRFPKISEHCRPNGMSRTQWTNGLMERRVIYELVSTTQ